MEIRPHRIINRKKTKKIKVGSIFVGGDSPISVQSMTNTLTTDHKSTINQIKELEEAGADIVKFQTYTSTGLLCRKRSFRTYNRNPNRRRSLS